MRVLACKSVQMSLCALLVMGSLRTAADAQSFHLRLVQEKTGRERNNFFVEVNVSRTSQPLPIDRVGAADYVVQTQGHDLIYVAWIGHAPKHYWSDFVTSLHCKYSGLGEEISVAAIRETGAIVGDWCGPAKAAPRSVQPGELLVFVRPVRWWEKID